MLFNDFTQILLVFRFPFTVLYFYSSPKKFGLFFRDDAFIGLNAKKPTIDGLIIFV